MHYLRWKWPTTAYGWQLAGCNYDSSLCYPDRPGFRTGTVILILCLIHWNNAPYYSATFSRDGMQRNCTTLSALQQ